MSLFVSGPFHSQEIDVKNQNAGRLPAFLAITQDGQEHKYRRETLTTGEKKPTVIYVWEESKTLRDAKNEKEN